MVNSPGFPFLQPRGLGSGALMERRMSFSFHFPSLHVLRCFQSLFLLSLPCWFWSMYTRKKGSGKETHEQRTPSEVDCKFSISKRLAPSLFLSTSSLALWSLLLGPSNFVFGHGWMLPYTSWSLSVPPSVLGFQHPLLSIYHQLPSPPPDELIALNS